MHTSKLMFINKLTTAKDIKTCCKEVRHLEINHILSYHMRITIESAMLVFFERKKSFNYKPTSKDDVMVTPRSLWHYVSNFYALDQKRYRMVYANYDEALSPMNMYLGLK